MCGRFNVIDNPGLQQLLQDLGIDLHIPRAVNLAPTDTLSLVRDGVDEREMVQARWWLTPAWARQVDQKYAMFNARSETLASSRAYSQPFRSQRALVPVSSFIEWRTEGGIKQAYNISSETGALAIAALWDVWEGGEVPLLSATLVTTAAAPVFLPYHSRMPVLLTPEEWPRWLDNSTPVAVDDPLFKPCLKQSLELAPLAAGVGNARNKSEEVLEPAGQVIHLPAG